MQLDRPARESPSHHACIVRRTEEAISGLREAGERISYYNVSKKAQVARSTLYRCDDLRKIVAAARDNAPLPNEAPRNHGAYITELERQLVQVAAERDALEQRMRKTTSRRYSLVSLN